MISYPVSTPTSIGIANIELSASNAVAVSRSPFTFSQQVHTYPGQMWSATVSIPPVRKDLAEPWVAFLLSLRGQTGTFLLGDPNNTTPRGSALSFRKNLLTFTEQFDNAVWVKQGVTVSANSAISPDGNLTSDRLTESLDVSDTFHAITFTQSVTVGQQYTLSVFAKEVSGSAKRYLNIYANSGFSAPTGGSYGVTFDLASGGVTRQQNGWVGFSESFGNGWFRCSVVTSEAIGTTSGMRFNLSDQPNVGIPRTYVGDGTSGVFLWGAQLEEGPLTDYQPIADAYGPFVKGAGQTGGTLLVDGASPDEEGFLLAGDYIQLGAGSSATLHKVLVDVDTNEAGEATLEIWPGIRNAPADNAIVSVADCKGVFRLSGNSQSWSINDTSSYGIQFECMEAI